MALRGHGTRLALTFAGAALIGSGAGAGLGCVGAVDDGAPTGGAGNTGSGGRVIVGVGGNGGAIPGTGGAPGAGGNGGVAPGTGGGNGGATVADAYLPPRIRRLSNAEYDASVQALLGTKLTPSTTFPPDSRQGSYTLNDAQRVDPVLAKQLDVAAVSLVTEARGNGTLAKLAPCASPTTQGTTCATTFIQSFGKSVYRRPLTSDESSTMLTVYSTGASSPGVYNDGIDLTVRAFLQSAGFLYITELGDASTTATDGSLRLTAGEVATTLAYLITAGPPDQMLLDAAAAGTLDGADGREQQARRLLMTAPAHTRTVRLIREWLGIDAFGNVGKDATAYPAFAGVKSSMDAESASFVNEVVTNSTGTVGELLGADWSIIDAPLASVYGVTSAGAGKRTSLAAVGRRGILNQGAFLSTYAHASESGPVLRGVAVIRRVACLPLQSPAELNIVVTPPVPDPTKTTRQRFAAHAVPGCASCHNTIDSIGFSFEEFDGMGQRRATDSGLPVDATTTIAIGGDFDGSYADSNALAAALATSKNVQQCFARQVFRGSAGRSDSTEVPSENAFVQNVWAGLTPDKQPSVVETLIAFVRSQQFVKRSPAP